MSRVRAFAVFVAVATVACSTKDTTSTNNIPASTNPPSNVFSYTYSLQGFVADATTGARIGGDLQLFLIQGVDVRTPTRMNGAATDPLLGEFAFAGIPLDLNTANKTYKIVAVKPGYQRFEAEITKKAVVDVGTLNVVDSVYNMVGNIYMFPTGATVPAYEVTVLYYGQPVPNATVILDPAPQSNDSLYNPYHALANSTSQTGYIPSLTATTNAHGVARFEAVNLALGAAYQVQVLPVVFTEAAGTAVQLRRYDGTGTFLAGLGDIEQTVNMTDAVWDNLYIVSTSNDTLLGATTTNLSANGSISITFSAPVYLRRGTSGFSATLDPSLVGTVGDPNTTSELSADGRVLTITPNFSFTPQPQPWGGLAVTFGNGTAMVEPRDYPTGGRLVFGGTGLSYVGDLTKHIPPKVWMVAP